MSDLARERHGITSAVAFSVLVRYSRDSDIKLVDIASDVVRTVTAA